MGTKYCLTCGERWTYEGAQLNVGSMCERCEKLSKERFERGMGKSNRRAAYKKSILNYPNIRKYLAGCTEAEREKCMGLWRILKSSTRKYLD